MPTPKPMYARVGVGPVLADLSHGELVVGLGISYYQRKKASVKLFRAEICRAIGWPADPSHERMVTRFSSSLAKEKEGYLKKQRGGRGQPTTYSLTAKFRGAVEPERAPAVPSEANPERTDSTRSESPERTDSTAPESPERTDQGTPVPVRTTTKTTTTKPGVATDDTGAVAAFLRTQPETLRHDYAKAVLDGEGQFGSAVVKKALAQLSLQQLSTLSAPLPKYFWGIMKRLAGEGDRAAEEAAEREARRELPVAEQTAALDQLRKEEGDAAVAQFVADQGHMESPAVDQFDRWAYQNGDRTRIAARAKTG